MTKSLPDSDNTEQETSPTPEDLNEETVPQDTLLDDLDDLDDPEELKALLQIEREALKKSESDKENYKKGMLKYKNLEKDDHPLKEKPTEFITKSEFYKDNEKSAIKNMTDKNPELNENWEEIIQYYAPINGKSSVKGIEEDIDAALDRWKKKNTSDDERASTRKTSSEITSSTYKTHGDKTTPQPVKEKGKYKVLKTNVGIDSWY